VAKAVRSKSSRTKKSASARGEAAKAESRADAKRADAKGGAARKPPAKRGRGQKSRPTAKKERKGALKFLREVRIELGKVTWPTRKDLVQSTIVVLVACAIAASYIFVLDTAFQEIMNAVWPG
jgi:preprotein translocase subunit SecE